jgi:hypothetical protein
VWKCDFNAVSSGGLEVDVPPRVVRLHEHDPVAPSRDCDTIRHLHRETAPKGPTPLLDVPSPRVEYIDTVDVLALAERIGECDG